MEHIFYATLALCVAGKPVNKESIRKLLTAANAPADEVALDAMVAFVRLLEKAKGRIPEPVDERIIKLLAAELQQRKAQAGMLEDLLQELRGGSAQANRTVPTPQVAEHDDPVKQGTTGVQTTQATAPIPPARGVGSSSDAARYVYGIADQGVSLDLGDIGIEGNRVYTIPYKDICVIVHDCPSEPYQSDDEGTVRAWVQAHQHVLDEAISRFGNVIPLGFDTIIRPGAGRDDLNQEVHDWLEEDYDRLKSLFTRVAGKAEYAVKIYYDIEVMAEDVLREDEDLKRLKEEVSTKPPGLAYMYKQKLEAALRSAIQRRASGCSASFYREIQLCVDEVITESPRKEDGSRAVLLSLSCLVTKNRAEELGEVLERINNMRGFSVHFSGPWPPYSFVGELPARAAQVG
ncbi:MAG: GvpL/GvpF family gas vesicle protein [Bacillota bacterium]